MKKLIKYIKYTFISIVTLIIITIIGNTIKISNSKAYEVAQNEIKTNNQIINSIGKIINFGKFPRGSIRMENGKYYAQLEITIIGELKTSNAVLYMEKINEQWIINEIFLYD